MKKIFFYAALILSIFSCNNKPEGNDSDGNKPPAPKNMSYSIIATYPHDTSSFTEGLLFYKGDLYESTGNKGFSRLIKVDLKTGKSTQAIKLDSAYFGEGIVIVNDTVYQLTYQEKVGFMYAVNSFKKLKEFSFAAKEGWGMTSNGKEIIATDGSSNLFYYEPTTFKLLKTQEVTESGQPAFNLNELEYIDGYIYANQYQYPYILKIDPNNGVIVAKADLTDLVNRAKAENPQADVLNGIAYDPATKKIYVTGKWWPQMYEVKFGQ